MKLVGLMVVRNEDWILGASARAALRWCDEIVILDHASFDGTRAILGEVAGEHPGRVHVLYREDPHWQEMAHRQATLDAGLAAGGTHFAIVDADEILGAPFRTTIRAAISVLGVGEVLSVPMIPVWRSLAQRRDDASVWARASLTLAFRYRPGLGWHAALKDGYDHHHRTPYGAAGMQHAGDLGRVMHLQFANWTRLVAKHVWYRMTEHLRWPGRSLPTSLNKQYDLALDERDIRLSPIPPDWIDADLRPLIKLDGEPWHLWAIREMVAQHGRARFDGLDLKGLA